MNQTIFIGRCDDDYDVLFPFHWANRIREEAEKLELDIIDLQKEKYTEEKTTKLVEEHNPFFLFLNGHGAAWCSKGHQSIPVLIANKNDFLLKGKIVYVVSCYTAQYLGQVACDKGCRAYIGYEDNFAFVYMDVDKPHDDSIAKIYMEASNEVPLTILNGGTPKDAFKKSQETFDKWINFWEKRWLGEEKTKVPIKVIGEILATLITNKVGQRLFYNEPP